MKAILLLVLLVVHTNVWSAVRWNSVTGLWEGNICMNNVGWQVVPFQPLGSICRIALPGYPVMQGIIINA